jgi:hypothetical protein
MFERATNLAAEVHLSKVLIDGLRLTGDLSDIDRIDLAVKATDHLRQLGTHPAIAVVGNPPTFNGLAVLAAQSIGAEIQLFPNVPEAVEWLNKTLGRWR